MQLNQKFMIQPKVVTGQIDINQKSCPTLKNTRTIN